MLHIQLLLQSLGFLLILSYLAQALIILLALLSLCSVLSLRLAIYSSARSSAVDNLSLSILHEPNTISSDRNPVLGVTKYPH